MVSLMCTLQHHGDDINWCAFSPTLLDTCSGDKTIRVYDSADFSELQFSPLSGHGYAVHCCCFSTCGRYIVTCSTDGSTIIWSMETGEMVSTFEPLLIADFRHCALSPDSTFLVAGASDGTVVLWAFHSKTIRSHGAVSEATVLALCFSPNGLVFVTGCSYGDIKLWDVDMRLLFTEKYAHDLCVACCQFAAQNEIEGARELLRLGSCGQDVRAASGLLWAGRPGCVWAPVGRTSGLRLGSCGQDVRAASGLLWAGRPGCVWPPVGRTSGLRLGSCRQDVRAASGFLWAGRRPGCVWAPVGRTSGLRLGSCGQDVQVKLWIFSQHSGEDRMTRLLCTLTGQSAPVLFCAFSSDGDMLVSGSVDKSVTVYDANQGVLLHSLKQHERYVTAVDFSPTRPWMASGLWEGERGSRLNLSSPQTKVLLVWLLRFSWCGCSGSPGSPGVAAQVLLVWLLRFSWCSCSGSPGVAAQVLLVWLLTSLTGEGMLYTALEDVISGQLVSCHGCHQGRQKVEELKDGLSGPRAPDEFLCPITRELMREPVIAADGYSYEREVIESTVLTNLPLPNTVLTPNRRLKTAIARWKSSR
ncbi:LOW QUALITY PROTEIN: WD repeat, SAM and U-box domain-containing protein 1-like [Osmerus eperlanus]|uniref:LOW QUALITY PROTEIN: WD repeat, SAM and U-box domain-containing protein 1-like n=1 Tax=Osmerus eperlanus TaxID=29151 RepID=UPI002E119F50